ncbi:MAG: hypothetical protein WC829_01105 [Hyphomicrobium sp.]|jgi:hypothetical protein
MKQGKILFVAAVGALMFTLVMSALARAEDCPAGVKSCKVLVLTPDEEATLAGPEMILDHATWANRVKFDSLARAWRDKLAAAPAGKVIEPNKSPKAADPSKPEKK